jgi:REP element-mobilizing transposase RayT
MPIEALITPLRPGLYYHVYNRGNNKEKLFFYEGDYSFFMEKYYHYLKDYADTYAYCLLPNHFHFLVKIKEDLPEDHRIISNQFRRLFICYSMRINIREKRSGSLLTKNYRRIEIKDEEYFRNLVVYIHYNPVRHGLTTRFMSYGYSSFKPIINNRLPGIVSDDIYEWYGGPEFFFEKHHMIETDRALKNLIDEDW